MTENTMAQKGKEDKRTTMAYKNLHWKLQIEQRKPH